MEFLKTLPKQSKEKLSKPQTNEIPLKVNRAAQTLPKNPSPINSINQTLQWLFIQNLQLDSNGNPLVMNIKDNNYGPDNSCILYPIADGTAWNSTTDNELWQLTKDGHILSRVASNIALDIGGFIEGSNPPAYNVVVAMYDSASQTQLWTVNNNIISNNAYTGYNLGIQNAISGPVTPSSDNVIVIASGVDNVCFNWSFSPSCPLDKILLQPSQPFPVFTGDQLTAYTDISLTVSGSAFNDIRSQYVNLNAPLADYKSSMDSMQCPNGVNQDDFNTVKTQLDKELTCASAVVQLFTNYFDFHQSLFTDSQGHLTQLGIDCGLEIQNSDAAVNSSMLALFSGIIYTILCAVPGGEGVAWFGVVANIIQTGINVGVSATSNSQGYISPDPFQVELSSLWSQLDKNFEALNISIGTIATQVLTDWGRLYDVYTLTTLPSNNINSLFWPPTLTGNAIKAAGVGYDISVLQILMPAKYQIYAYNSALGPNDGYNPNLPSSISWTEPGGAKLLFFVADNQDSSSYPTDDLMNNSIWNSGLVSRYDFFKSCNGWNWPTAIIEYNVMEYRYGVLTFCNNTPTPINMTLTYDSEATSYPIGTYSSSIGKDYESDFSVSITDSNNNKITNFDVTITHSVLEGCEISVLNTPTVADGYTLSQPICNQGSLANVFSAAIGITLSLSNPTN